jgi:hypothetical protein
MEMTTNTGTGIWRFLTGNPEADVIDGVELVWDWVVEHTPTEEEHLFDILLVRTHEAINHMRRFGKPPLEFNLKLSLKASMVLYYDSTRPSDTDVVYKQGYEGRIEVCEEGSKVAIGERPFFLQMACNRIIGIFAKPLPVNEVKLSDISRV